MKLKILVGTMTGNATLVAQEIELTFADEGLDIVVVPMDGLGTDAFSQEAIYLICTSTYGQGDIPDNARPFFDALSANRPDLGDVRYGVLGLGDRTYVDTFNHGGMKFDELLTSLGAQRIGSRAMLDASSGELPEETAVVWFGDWLSEVRAQDPAAA